MSGKAEVLHQLQKAGFNIPKFVICESSWNEKRVRNESNKLSGVKYFAVRSSAADEDSKKKSNAGRYYSALGVERGDIYKEFLKVVGSYNGKMGKVIVQEFIPSDAGGVIFVDRDNPTVVNSTIGLCKAVVEGQSCDEFLVKEGEIISKTISKKIIYIFRGGKITKGESLRQSLTETQLMELTRIALKIEILLMAPQDIEWCIKNNKVCILQSRPITAKLISNVLTYYDSANIAESYSGIVLPLTFSFAQMVYARIYKDLLLHSGVSKISIKRHSGLFANLLHHQSGHVYYNMNNWYQLGAFLPGYKRNKKNFENMITSNTKDEIYSNIKPAPSLVLLYPWILLFKIITFSSNSNAFLENAKKQLVRLKTTNFNKLSYPKCVQLFENINTKLLYNWYIPVENDFMVMTYLGLLEKISGKKKIQHEITFPSKSTEQVKALCQLSKNMFTHPNLAKAIELANVSKFNSEIKKYKEIDKELDLYLETFGGRFANELKLESVDIDEDRKKLLSLIKIYKNYKFKTITSKPKVKLGFAKRLAFYILLNRFKSHASKREEFRLLRSNSFGMMRKLLLRMGNILNQQNIIIETQDIFYMTLEEVLSHPKKSQNIKNSILTRKKIFASYVNLKPPSHFTMSNGKIFTNPETPNKNGSAIVAKPAAAGIVRGKVKVMTEFEMLDTIDFDILVTSHTDPGWTSLLALCKGLIIEHGGVLSHASIVARELGIPTVVGASNAMRILKDGQTVEIDGSKGTIKIIK